MDHVMFENEDGTVECVACGRKVFLSHLPPYFKSLADGDVMVNHRYSKSPFLSISGTEVVQ